MNIGSKSKLHKLQSQEQSHNFAAMKPESISSKGYGNGFASSVDRFTGVNESKFASATVPQSPNAIDRQLSDKKNYFNQQVKVPKP